MSGHRDDGTFADDKAHHPNRKVGRVTYSQNTDVAPAHGIPRPNTDEILDEWDPEDIAEKNYWDRANMNVNLGNHPEHENEKPSHMKYGWE